MKRSLASLSSLLVVVLLASSSWAQADSRESKRLQAGKITKNEAQHLVIKQFPGATIKSCELQTENGHSVWLVSLVKASNEAAKVKVDGASGAITP